MPLNFVQGDITKIKCDAIVNAANNSLLGGGGVDGAIHRAAGKGLLEECRKLGGCETGQAKITGAYNLPCKYVIHTVGPIYKNGRHSERELLESCYVNSLELAKQNGCKTIAFPMISAGVYGYPFADALRVAVDTSRKFLTKNEMTIYIVIFDKKEFRIDSKLYEQAESYIDFNYAGVYYDEKAERLRRAGMMFVNDTIPGQKSIEYNEKKDSVSLKDALSQMDEPFHSLMMRRLDEKEISDGLCCKKANLDYGYITKLRENSDFIPAKFELISIAFALELTLEETNELLQKAGYSLSHGDKIDVIAEFFLLKKNYNIFEFNEVIFAFN